MIHKDPKDDKLHVYIVIVEFGMTDNIATATAARTTQAQAVAPSKPGAASIIQGTFVSCHSAVGYVKDEIAKERKQAMGQYLVVKEFGRDYPKFFTLYYSIGDKKMPSKTFKILRHELQGSPLELLGLQAE